MGNSHLVKPTNPNLIPEPWATRKTALYVLGAGFSAAAGLPLANDLWREVYRRALSTRWTSQFREDLDEYVEFKEKCDGVRLERDQVDFEEFLGFLDIEHYLRLRGKDTWSDDGNETQVIIKTLIGQILTERTPQSHAIPELYLRFAERLQPYDRIVTFNYDVLLERACEAVGKPFRLGHGHSLSRDEVITIFKLHGSIDWFDKKQYLLLQQTARENGYPGYIPDDPIFNSVKRLRTTPLVPGPRSDDDPLRNVHRVLDIERLYSSPPFLSATPVLSNPSTAKVIYSQRFTEFWNNQGEAGAHNFRMAIIGYSLPPHDDYARQFLYLSVRNYQEIPGKDVDGTGGKRGEKESLIFVDLCKDAAHKNEIQNRYRFVNWIRSRSFFDGFNEDVIAAL
jgi:hypothetical protein